MNKAIADFIKQWVAITKKLYIVSFKDTFIKNTIMKNVLFLSITFILCNYQVKSIEPKLDKFIKTIAWSGQASVAFPLNDKQIYLDPYQLKSTGKADLIFITHSHGDHLSIDDVKKIATASTKIYAPESCHADLQSAGFNPVKVLPGETLSIDGIKINVVPAYTMTKSTHPKSNNWVGYVLKADGIKIYHPGDTEHIPEMKNIDCNITFMPLGQKYTMNSVDDAVQSAIDVKAEVAIPFHYGMYEGKDEDAVEFKEKLKNKIEVVLLER